jgi:hypothetical protein
MEDRGNRLLHSHSQTAILDPLSSIFSEITFTPWITLNQMNSTSPMC